MRIDDIKDAHMTLYQIFPATMSTAYMAASMLGVDRLCGPQSWGSPLLVLVREDEETAFASLLTEKATENPDFGLRCERITDPLLICKYADGP